MDSSDAGGVAAKHGFLYQDCVAALTVAQMLFDKKMHSVGFEVTDDIDVEWDTHVEFIQVKGAADKSWTPTVISECDKRKTTTGGRSKTIPDSSIIHKQMLLVDRPINHCQFRIVTTQEPKSGLDYLINERGKRKEKATARDALIQDLDKRMKSFVAPQGNDVKHWVDAAWWQVMHTIDHIELKALRLIRRAASDVAGISLGNDEDVEAIWRDILLTITKKSALSRKIHCADDKTYFRHDLLVWFRGEVAHYEKHSHERTKIYVKRLPLQILLPLKALPSPTGKPTRSGQVLHQEFSVGKYRYGHIAEAFCEWLDEVLLLPREIADLARLGTRQRYQVLVERIKAHSQAFEELLGRVLLHSAIRHERESQPIPATLYTEHPSGLKLLDNVHIVVNAPQPDELWIGISHILDATSEPSDLIKTLREDLYNHVRDHIDETRQRILHVKEDSYLLAHDVDDILNIGRSFSVHGSRYQFKIFFGYDTAVPCNLAPIASYQDQLVAEATCLLNDFCDDMADHHVHELHVSVYLYPVPSLDELSKKIQEKLSELR